MRKKKGSACLEDMATLISSQFLINGRVACGIVYCLSRNDCEKVAADLQVNFDRFLRPSFVEISFQNCILKMYRLHASAHCHCGWLVQAEKDGS